VVRHERAGCRNGLTLRCKSPSGKIHGEAFAASRLSVGREGRVPGEAGGNGSRGQSWGGAVAAPSIALPTPARALTSVRECRDIQQEPDMTQRLTENWWLVDWSLVTIMGNTMPPRDPNDDDDDEDEDDEDQHDEPAVIREPDDDE
jgi:hypothetical protein